MKDKLEDILSMLRKEYNQRQELISDNIRDIENSLVTRESINMSMDLDEINNELRKRNDVNIELQNVILKYLKENAKYPTEFSGSMSYEECFQLTITGDMDYNPRNPFFFDYGFYVKLLEYFIEREDYEKCHLIKRKRTDVLG